MSIKKNQPIFKSVFGTKWDKLPIIVKKHYANYPFSNDIVRVSGIMEVKFSFIGRILMPFFSLTGTLIPYQGKNIKTTVTHRSNPNDNTFSFDRNLEFEKGKKFRFHSIMKPMGGNRIIEYMKFGIGWNMYYDYNNDLVTLNHISYIIKIGKFYIRLPLEFILGRGYAQEKIISDKEFEMFVTMTHPLWGEIYRYTGKFKIDTEKLK